MFDFSIKLERKRIKIMMKINPSWLFFSFCSFCFEIFIGFLIKLWDLWSFFPLNLWGEKVKCEKFSIGLLEMSRFFLDEWKFLVFEKLCGKFMANFPIFFGQFWWSFCVEHEVKFSWF
jgi:hypothetical protein